MKLSLRRPQPADLRVWHWCNALVVNGLLLTVLIRRCFFGIRFNASLIESKLSAAEVKVDHKLTREIADAMADRFWNWHIFLGYCLGTLILFRVVVALRVRQTPLRLAVLSYRQYKEVNQGERFEALQYFVIRANYLGFYIACAFMVLSGLAMVFDDELKLSDNFRGNLHAVHEFFQWYFLAFVILHIGGVVWAELRKFPGIVSTMINGK